MRPHLNYFWRNKLPGAALLLALLIAPTLTFGQASVSVHLTFGNPSKARDDGKDRDNFLIVHAEWAASWNASKGHPNWVSWRLAAEDLGDADRTGMQFHPDPNLPTEWPRIVHGLYAGGGFDQFHCCPAADRSRRLATLQATFSTANCFPGSPPLNRGVWERAEDYRRDRARSGQELYIIAGPAGRGGRGDHGYRQQLGDADRQINVPAYTWVAWLELDDRNGNDVARVNRQTPVHALIFHNDRDVPDDWRAAGRSIDDVEELTEDLNLFSELTSEIQRPLESRSPE